MVSTLGDTLSQRTAKGASTPTTGTASLPMLDAVSQPGASAPIASNGFTQFDLGLDGALLGKRDQAGGAAWFRAELDEWRFVAPEHDDRIPLSRWVRRFRESRSVSVLSYRPGRRCVVRVFGRSAAGRFSVVKGFRRGRSARALHRHLVARRIAEFAGFKVPGVWFHYPSAEAIVLEGVTGRAFRWDGGDVGSAQTLGRCLRAFQTWPSAESLPVVDEHNEMCVLDQWRARVARLASVPRGWDRLQRRLARWPVDTTSARGFAHGDLHEGQILLDGRSLIWLDFDSLCRASTGLDPGNLLAHLRLRQLQFPASFDDDSARRARDAFLSGWRGERRAEPAEDASLVFYEAASLLRLALVYRLRPQWQHLSDRLVSSAGKLMDASR